MAGCDESRTTKQHAAANTPTNTTDTHHHARPILHPSKTTTGGLSQVLEQQVVRLARSCAEEPLDDAEVEIDQVARGKRRTGW